MVETRAGCKRLSSRVSSMSWTWSSSASAPSATSCSWGRITACIGSMRKCSLNWTIRRASEAVYQSLGLAAFLGVWVGHGLGGPAGRTLLVGAILLAAFLSRSPYAWHNWWPACQDQFSSKSFEIELALAVGSAYHPCPKARRGTRPGASDAAFVGGRRTCLLPIAWISAARL